MYSSISNKRWSPSRTWFLWFVVIDLLLVATLVTAWFMVGAWILAALNVTPAHATVTLAGRALWLIPYVGVATAYLLTTAALCYSFTMHHHNLPRNVGLLLPTAFANRWLRSTVLAMVTPLLLLAATSTEPFAVGLSATVATTCATTWFTVQAVRGTVRTYLRTTETPRFPHPTTRSTDLRTPIGIGWQFNGDWERPDVIRNPGIRRLYADAARWSAKLRRVVGELIRVVTVALIIPLSVWTWREDPGPLPLLPLLVVGSAWIVGVHLVHSADEYAKLAESYRQGVPLQETRSAGIARSARLTHRNRRLGTMRPTY
jgi:hypothetical protein